MLRPVLDGDTCRDAVHRRDVLLGQHLLRPPVREYMRIPQHEDRIAKERGEVEVVNGHEYGDILSLGDLRDEAEGAAAFSHEKSLPSCPSQDAVARTKSAPAYEIR